MIQYPFQGGLIVILIPCCVGLFELPDRAERFKKKRGGRGWYLIIYFMCFVLSLTFGEWAVMEAPVA